MTKKIIDVSDIKAGDVLPGNLERLPKSHTYDGQPLIKRANVKIKMSKAQIAEVVKCAKDVIYFAENYIHIIDPDEGKVVVKLRDYQTGFLEHLNKNRFNVILAPRQIGKSTMCAIWILHYIVFNANKRVVLFAHKGEIAKEIFQRIRLAYEELPYWMQIGVLEWQKTSCQLENGSSCSCAATTAEGMRGITGNVIFMDEFAHIRRNVADDFFTAMYPTISASKKSKIIVVSTPNGLNHFHSMWSKAKKGKNSFAPFRVHWEEVPNYDEAWKEETLKNIGERRFCQEYECGFLGSTKTLIDPVVLENMESENAKDYDYDGHLTIYDRCRKHNRYCIGVDTAKGAGGDYSVAQVIDITKYPFKQVAIYRYNKVSTRNFADIVEKMGNMYNEASIIVENNDIGQAVCDYLWHDIEYENLVNIGHKMDLGIRSTKRTKSIALDILKWYLETNKLQVFDQDTIYELSKFIEVRDGIYKAEEGEHDDTVMALMWACYIIKTSYFDEDETPNADVDGKLADEEDEESDTDDMPIASVDSIDLDNYTVDGIDFFDIEKQM